MKTLSPKSLPPLSGRTAGALFLSLLIISPTLLAAEKKKTEIADHPSVRGDEITPAQQECVRRGLKWLASHQQRDGAYTIGGSTKHAGVTALGGLALMQAGNLPG